MYGLVLEGGGARGSYHIGAYKALEDLGITDEISVVTGTSIGSINGAMIVQGDADYAEKMWREAIYSMAVKVDDELVYDLIHGDKSIKNLPRDLSSIVNVFSKGGLDITPLKELLNAKVDEEKVRNSKMKLGLVTVNISDLQPLELYIDEIPEGELVNYLIASSYLPGFKMEPLSGKYYLDGGFYDRMPIKMLKRVDVDKAIAIRTHKDKVDKEILNNENIIMVEPKQELFGIYDITPENGVYGLNLGYYDTMRTFKNLYGEKYYIEPFEEEFAFEFFNRDVEVMKRVNGIMKNEEGSVYRNYYEKSIPTLFKILNIDDGNLSDLLIAALEVRLTSLEVDQFKIYTVEELLEKVKGSQFCQMEDRESILAILVSRINPVNILNSEEIITNVLDILFE